MDNQITQKHCRHWQQHYLQQPHRQQPWRVHAQRQISSRLDRALEARYVHTGCRRLGRTACPSSGPQSQGHAEQPGVAAETVRAEAQEVHESQSEAEVHSDSGPRAPSVWDLPLDALRPQDGVGWGEDPAGPTGPENLDNIYDNKIQCLSNSDAIDFMGMGSWRLRGYSSPLFQVLVANIEGAWRHLIEDLGLFILPKEWKYVDSLDPKVKYGSWSHQDLEPPSKGAKGWPRLQIENRCYQSRVFRKLHMEVAHRQDGLEVFHCVMYPRLEYDLPILSMDVVAKDGRVSLAIIDPCPVSLDRSLPSVYSQMMTTLQQGYGVHNNRSIPEWGQEIFSQHCVMMRPENEKELGKFVEYAVGLTRVHLRFAHNITPVKTNRASRMHAMKAAHIRYGEQQLRNNKTRRVLDAAFSPEFAESYMTGLMFDTVQKRSGTAEAAASPTEAPTDAQAKHPVGVR